MIVNISQVFRQRLEGRLSTLSLVHSVGMLPEEDFGPSREQGSKDILSAKSTERGVKGI